MKTKFLTVFCFSILLLILGIFHPAAANAGVNVNISIPLPGLVFAGPPAMMVIPGTYAYFAPDVEADVFFYHGCWYRPYRGRWYISLEYNGPWGSVAVGQVPSVLINLPPSYRHVPPGYERMPYGMVRRNWRGWEEERYWDNYSRRKRSENYDGDEYAGPRSGHGMGRGMGMGRHGDSNY